MVQAVPSHLIVSSGRTRTTMTTTIIRNRPAVAPRRPRSSAVASMLSTIRTIPADESQDAARAGGLLPSKSDTATQVQTLQPAGSSDKAVDGKPLKG
jgi:hypothetical protein